MAMVQKGQFLHPGSTNEEGVAQSCSQLLKGMEGEQKINLCGYKVFRIGVCWLLLHNLIQSS
jgi:hypothetical protein